MIIIQIIDSNTVVVTTSDELKQVISEDNNYDYIYLGNDITATSGFVINGNKSKVIIDCSEKMNDYVNRVIPKEEKKSNEILLNNLDTNLIASKYL